MIGNDIVDLKKAAIDSNWQRPRFLDKVFTEIEQELISISNNKHHMVWLLWSMKEAAYKVNVQQFGKRFFNPKRLECELVSLEKGSVRIDDEIYFTTSKITEEFVYTIATLNVEQSDTSACFKFKNLDLKTHSETLKSRFLKSLNMDLTEIKKNDVGIPGLFQNEKAVDLSFSLTHHGAFGAFAIL